MAAGRGALVLLVAVVIGIVLLNQVDSSPSTRITTGNGNDDEEAEETTTTVVAVPVPTTAPARQPGEVKVLSANGTRVNGAAGRIRDVLKAVGYNVLSPIETRSPVRASAVYFTPGFDREAQVVAQVLKLQPTAVQPLPAANALPVSDLRGANVLAVVGPDLARQATATTTTTSRTRGTARSTTSTTTAPTATTATTARPAA